MGVMYQQTPISTVIFLIASVWEREYITVSQGQIAWTHSVSEAGILFVKLSGVTKYGTIASFNFNTLTWNFLQGHSIFSISFHRKMFLVFTGIKLA